VRDSAAVRLLYFNDRFRVIITYAPKLPADVVATTKASIADCADTSVCANSIAQYLETVAKP
jgi:hypothetical protein